MYIMQADVFIALPGGVGTMEELTEILTWSKLDLHHKPVGLLNINSYYDFFLQWVRCTDRLINVVGELVSVLELCEMDAFYM